MDSYTWLLPAGVMVYLAIWIVLPLVRKQPGAGLVVGLRAGGGVALSAAVWLIWWLV